MNNTGKPLSLWVVLRIKDCIAAGELDDKAIAQLHGCGKDMVNRIRSGERYADVTPEYAQAEHDKKLEQLRERYRYWTNSLKNSGVL